MNSIYCQNLKVAYNGNAVISDLDLKVSSGTWTTVIGPNGAGKSSLMHAILGLVPSKGSIQISGDEVSNLSLTNLAKKVAFVPQEPVIPDGMKVFDYVLLGRIHNLGFFAAESSVDIDIAEDILKKLDAYHLIDRVVDTLSGGERQRIVLARALTQKSPILILDEPTTALDISHQHEFLNLIDEFCIKENLTVNIEEVQKECARFMLQYDWIKNTYTAEQLHNAEYQNSFHSLIQRGYNQKRSGDVIVSIQSGWLDSGWEDGGTSHGSSYSYDTHVPLIFWGSNIKKGVTDRLVNIRDIAPTISTLLGVSFPNGCTGNPIVEITQ